MTDIFTDTQVGIVLLIWLLGLFIGIAFTLWFQDIEKEVGRGKG